MAKATIRKRTKQRTPGALKGKIRLGKASCRPLTKRELALWEKAPLFPSEK
jgi:hypothetical protein